MRTTLNLDEAILKKASDLSGISEKTKLLHEGLKALIAKHSALRLSKLGGTYHKLKNIPR